MNCTIKDIAREAGVSTATVSLALKGDARVKLKTSRRIAEIAARLSYVPNNFGRALQANRSMLIGYLAHSIDTSYWNEVLQGAGLAATEAGYGLLTGFSGSLAGDEMLLRLFAEKRIDGLIVSQYNQDLLPKLIELHEDGLPIVFASADSLIDGVPSIKNDDVKSGMLAAEHFIESGLSGIAYYGCEAMSSSERFRGLKESLAAYGKHVVCCNNASLMKALLGSKKQRPEAVMAYSDAMAVEVRNIMDELGLKCPDEIHLLGVDDSECARLPAYDFTSVAPQKAEIGRLSVKTLLQIMDGATPESIFLEPSLVCRSSSPRRA